MNSPHNNMDTEEDVKEDKEAVDVEDEDGAADEEAVATMVTGIMANNISHRQYSSIKPQQQCRKLEAFHLHQDNNTDSSSVRATTNRTPSSTTTTGTCVATVDMTS